MFKLMKKKYILQFRSVEMAPLSSQRHIVSVSDPTVHGPSNQFFLLTNEFY